MKTCKRCGIKFTTERVISKERYCLDCKVRKRKKVIEKPSQPFAQKVKVAMMMRELVDSILDYGVQQGMKAVRGNSLDTRVCIDCGTIYLTEKVSKAKCPACNSKVSVEYQGGGELSVDEVTNKVTELNNER